MRYEPANATRRCGAVAPLTLILLVPLVGMMAFSIDIGYIVNVQTELQNAADAAALAGAEKLQDLYVQYYQPGQTQQLQVFQKATTNTGTSDCPMYVAEQYSAYNKAGNVSVVMRDTDVSFTYNDGSTTPQAANYPSLFPNTITVIARRDNFANGPLGLFFGQIFNVSNVPLTATAKATIYAGDVTSLTVIPGVDAHILPVALDVNIWRTFYTTGLSPDGTIHVGPDGNPMLHVYPYPGNAPGSFGLLDTGPPANNVPAFRNWIDDGVTPNDIQYLLNNNLLPVSPTAPQWWKCGPGLKSTLVSNFQDQLNKPNLIPLFIPVNADPNNYQAAQGNGQNAQYNVEGFAGVKIVQATGQGSSMDISVQPSAIVDPTASILNPQPARPSQPTAFTNNSGSPIPLTTFISAKLTQ